ncbi:biotin/lipoyl-binding protein [Marivita sp.]|uniref:biotin/lipoyl-binding protein n=1 Tax=Marivita sp. TaxID=2003365 RepID=UPI003B595ABA
MKQPPHKAQVFRVGLVGLRVGQAGGGATAVVLMPLNMQPFEDTFRAIGSSEAVTSATLTSDVSGRVVEVNLSSNAQVSEGDLLVQLDAPRGHPVP